MKYSPEYWADVDRALAAVPGVERLDGAEVVLTGATGLIGSSVADLLLRLRQRGVHISLTLAGRSAERTAMRFAGFAEGADYRFAPYDATAIEAATVPAADFVVHCASNAHPALFATQPVETMMANLFGLRALLEVVRRRPGARLLYLSSSEVYGQRVCAAAPTQPQQEAPSQPSETAQLPFAEDDYGRVDILNPRAAYPSAKRAAETLCAAYHAEHGVDAVMARPGHVYGPAMTATDSRAAAQFACRAAAGLPIVMKSAGTQLRSYCYQLDCASALLTVMLRGETATAYNIANPQSTVTVRGMAEALARAAGTTVTFEQPTDAERRSYNLMDNSSLLATRLCALGWRGLFSIDEGAERTLRFL